jgi:hypothetical protein
MAVYQEMRDEYVATLQKECEKMIVNLHVLSDPLFLLNEGTTGLSLAQEIESIIWDKYDDGNQGWNDENHPYDIAMEPLIQSLVSYNQSDQEDWNKWYELLLYYCPGDLQKVNKVIEHSLVRTPKQCHDVLVDFFCNLNYRLIQHGKYPENEMIPGEIEFRVQAIIEYWEDWAFADDHAKIEEKVEKEMQKLRNAEPDFLTYRKYMHKKFQDTCDGRFKSYPNPNPNASNEGEIFSDEDNGEEHNGNYDTNTSDADDKTSDEDLPPYEGGYTMSDEESHASSNGNRHFNRSNNDVEGSEEPSPNNESDPSNNYSGQERDLDNKNEDSGNGDQNDQNPTDTNPDDGEDDDTVRDMWHNIICDAIDDIDKNLSRTSRFPFYVVDDSAHHTDILQSRFPPVKYRAQYETAGEALVKTLRNIKEKSQADDFLAWRHFLHVKFPTIYPKPKPSMKQRREEACTLILTEFKWFNAVIKTNDRFLQYVIGDEATLDDLACRHETNIYNDWYKVCPENEDEYSNFVEVDINELRAKKSRHTPELQFKNWRMFLNDTFPGVQLQSEEVSQPPTAQNSMHIAAAVASGPTQSNAEDTEMSGNAHVPLEELSSPQSPPLEAQHPSEQVIKGVFKGDITNLCYDPSGPDNGNSDDEDNEENRAVIDILATLTAAFNNSLQCEYAGHHIQYIVQDERKFAKALRRKFCSSTTDTELYEAVTKSRYESLNHAYQHRVTDDFLAWRNFLHDNFPGQYPVPVLVKDIGTEFSVFETAAVSSSSSDRIRPEDQDQEKSNFQTTRVRIRNTLRDNIETINNKIELDGRFPEYTVRGEQKLFELAEFLENEAFLRSGDRDDYENHVDACYGTLQLIEYHCESDDFFDWRMFLYRNFPAEKLPMPQRITTAPIGIPTESLQLSPVNDKATDNIHGNISDIQSPPILEQTGPGSVVQFVNMNSDGVQSMDIDPQDNDYTAIIRSGAAVDVNGVGIGFIPGLLATLTASGLSALPTVVSLESSLPAQNIGYSGDLDNTFGPDAFQNRTTLSKSESQNNPAPATVPRKMASPRRKLVRKPAPLPRMTSENKVSTFVNQLPPQMTATSQPLASPLKPAGPVMNPFDPALFKSFPKPVVPTGSVFGNVSSTPNRAPSKIITDFNGDSFGAFNISLSSSMKVEIPVKTVNTSAIVYGFPSVQQPEAKKIVAIPVSIDGPHVQSSHPADDENTPSIVQKPVSISEPEVETAPIVPISTVQPESKFPPRIQHHPEPKVQAVIVIPTAKVEPEPPRSPIEQHPNSGSNPDIELSPVSLHILDTLISENVQAAPAAQALIGSKAELESDSESELSSVPSDLSDRSELENTQTASLVQNPIVPSEPELQPIQLLIPVEEPVQMPGLDSPKTAPIVDQTEDGIQQSVDIIPESDTKLTVADAVLTTEIAPLQSDAILSAMRRDIMSKIAGIKTDIDLKEKLSIVQADLDELKVKLYEDRLVRVESDIAGIKEQVARNEEQNTKRHEESTAIQIATNNTINQIFAFLKANETGKRTVQVSRPVDAPSHMDSEQSRKTEPQEKLVKSSKQELIKIKASPKAEDTAAHEIVEQKEIVKELELEKPEELASQAAITEIRLLKIEVQGPSNIEGEKAVVKIETADPQVRESKSEPVSEEVGVKLVKEVTPTGAVATAKVDIIGTSTLQTTDLQPGLVPETFQAPQAYIKKLSLSSVTTLYVTEPSDSAGNGTPTADEPTPIKDLDIPLKQPTKSVPANQAPVKSDPVKKIDKASQMLPAEPPQQLAVTSSSARSATGLPDSRPTNRNSIEATELPIDLLKSARAYNAFSNTANSLQKAVEVTDTDVVLFNTDGSLNDAIPHDKVLLALSRHDYDLKPNERHVLVECARCCLSFKEFWARVEKEGLGDLHELGNDLLEVVKTYLRNILDIRTLAQHATLTGRIQAFRIACSAGESFRQCSKSVLQSIYEIHTTIKDNREIVRLEGRDLECEMYKRALSSFHWNTDYTIGKYWISHKKYMDALNKLQQFENDKYLARQIEIEHHTAQPYFEDQLRKLGIDPANPHTY